MIKSFSPSSQEAAEYRDTPRRGVVGMGTAVVESSHHKLLNKLLECGLFSIKTIGVSQSASLAKSGVKNWGSAW